MRGETTTMNGQPIAGAWAGGIRRGRGGRGVSALALGALLMRVVPRRPTKIYCMAVAILLAALVGLSRIFLGVHYPTDVLAGWLVGFSWALFCWLVERAIERLYENLFSKVKSRLSKRAASCTRDKKLVRTCMRSSMPSSLSDWSTTKTKCSVA